jgi:hypothetical protein
VVLHGVFQSLGAALIIRASPPEIDKHSTSLNLAAGIVKILLLSGVAGSFCSGHFNPFKTFKIYYGFDSAYYLSRCKEINGL